jgi:hypothetical protein
VKKKEGGQVAEFTCHAEVYKVQSLVDGGVRVTLNLPETEIGIAAIFMECQRLGIPLLMVAKADSG